MPHIKVKPFDIDTVKGKSGFIEFVAKSNFNDIVLINYKKNRIFLDIIKKDAQYLIKPNKITKISDISILKDILNRFAEELNLEILYSNTTPKPYKPKIAHWALKGIEDFYDFRSSYSKIKLEIGFGSGRHLLYRANKEKNTLFIGIEIHTPSINQLLKQVNLKGIKNIWVLNYDARLLLEIFPSNILDTIYVHFPVPWDKKPHRRVISNFFINEASRVIKKGGYLELRTDSEKYYKYSLEVFGSPKKSSFTILKNSDIEVNSKYEERWRKMDKNIYTLRFDILSNSKERSFDINFDFDNCEDILIEFPKESIVKEDFFVHFGKIYKKEIGFVVECSFGSFNMPEKKMIVVDGSSCYYLPSNPVKSLANFKAHNLIKEVIKNGKCNFSK